MAAQATAVVGVALQLDAPSLNEPLLRPARRLVPPISGFDLSPVVVMIALKLVEILFIRTIEDMAKMFL